MARLVEMLDCRVALLHLHDTVDGVEHHPPLSPDWRQRMVGLVQMAVRACVIETGADAGHGRLRASLAYLTELWAEVEER